MTGKNKILFYKDWDVHLSPLNVEQKARFLTWFLDYINDRNPEFPMDDPELIGPLYHIRSNLKTDLKKWVAKCETNRLNGQKGGRPNKTQKTQSVIKNPTKPKKGDKDKDKDIKENFIKEKTQGFITHVEKINNRPLMHFLTDEVIEAWGHWLDHKKAIKNKYTSVVGERWAFVKAANLANWKPDVFRKLVLNSISENWKGIHDPDKPISKK